MASPTGPVPLAHANACAANGKTVDGRTRSSDAREWLVPNQYTLNYQPIFRGEFVIGKRAARPRVRGVREA